MPNKIKIIKKKIQKLIIIKCVVMKLKKIFMQKFEIHTSLKIHKEVSETILSTTICPLSVPRLFKLSEK